MVEEFITLRNGAKMPRVGLGTWKAPAEMTKAAIKCAVKSGYRLIDTANDYANEHVIGDALEELFAEGVVKREELFIQCKLWNTNHRKEHVKQDLLDTLADLKLDYVDSFVIHWPQAVPSNGKHCVKRSDGCRLAHESEKTMFPVDDNGYFCSDKESHYVETWAVMEELVEQGLTKSIGLSNFNRRQIEEILSVTKKHFPCVLQNESHPYLHELDLRNFCAINKIAFQAYSALGSSDRPWRKFGSITSGAPKLGHEILEHPDILKIAEKYGKSTANVVIRWHLQQGGTLVAKSTNPGRIEANYKVWDFELSAEEMSFFEELNVGWRHLIWAETSDHPDYPFKDELPHDYVLGKPDKKLFERS